MESRRVYIQSQCGDIYRHPLDSCQFFQFSGWILLEANEKCHSKYNQLAVQGENNFSNSHKTDSIQDNNQGQKPRQ